MICQALEHLGMRECTLGGYCHMTVPFCPSVTSTSKCSSDCSSSQSFPVLVFTATQENNLYLGPAPLDELAKQIVSCNGTAGHNVEYVLRLAQFVRKYIKEDKDLHLFGLEFHIENLLRKMKICPEKLIWEHSPNKIPEVMKSVVGRDCRTFAMVVKNEKDCLLHHFHSPKPHFRMMEDRKEPVKSRHVRIHKLWIKTKA